ncbi:hypothetical protein Z945_720 [Sulfitobacter noctilucae]|uniref:LPS export ABC transporter periplasmic protein LptC n=1 Tax=Sulfitobacter noctilucae TaxID=1342302 RepID=UPI000468AECC|nr:LPS export ABC transporter periplasmic protein LptC [Sulfitobacter noctilucae]KIN65673.1 hypothetical protein Z945_720 [Sulfitobacter noctilucae]
MQTDRYTQLVGWLKVVLPLLALGLLSTLFLISRAIDPETAIPFADKEIQERLRDQQVTGPIYYAVTADGDQISFAADKLTTPEGMTGSNAAESVEVTMDLIGGTQVTLNALHGNFNIEQDNADLQGDVVIRTSTGYRLESERMITQMSSLDVTSPGRVQGDGPVGTLDAGAMTLSAGKQGAPAQLVFTKGVKLVYVPNIEEE